MLPIKNDGVGKNQRFSKKTKLPTQEKTIKCTVCGRPGHKTTVKSGRGVLTLCDFCEKTNQRREDKYPVSFSKASELDEEEVHE